MAGREAGQVCTLAIQAGMTNQWLKEQGLVSIKKLRVDIHYTATAR